jgi:hypothetical protein
MYLYKYSVVRFFPSPVRGECINLGLIVGSDERGDWLFETVSSRARANLLDEDRVFPMVAAELERQQAHLQRCQEEVLIPDKDEYSPSEQWLQQLALDSNNLLQYSPPQPVLALSAGDALERLWGSFIVEPAKQSRASIPRNSVVARYWSVLRDAVGPKHLKRSFVLDAQHTHSTIDVSLHNGIVKELTQCWSFQVKDKSVLLNDVKSWAFTIIQLRESGGKLHDRSHRIVYDVPKDVNVSVVYAPDAEPDEYVEEAFDVFADDRVQAARVELDHALKHAAAVSRLVSDH